MRLGTAAKDKPIVLFVMAGVHHLRLYQSIFETCHTVQWVIFVPDLDQIPQEDIDRLHRVFGVKFFVNRQSALVHFIDIDAVISVFDMPHLEHLRYLEFLTLAHEIGLPVLGIQHGILQLGISVHEDTALIGWGQSEAKVSLPTKGLIENVLTWGGPNGIGYPPFHNISEKQKHHRTNGLKRRVLFVTNFHGYITPYETKSGYDMLYDVITAMPACDFTILPHPAELNFVPFLELRAALAKSDTQNVQIPDVLSSQDRLSLLSQSDVAVCGLSTMLLELEMLEVPTFLFGFDTYDPLLELFENCATLKDSQEMQDTLERALYFHHVPYFRSGLLQPFAPDRFMAQLMAVLPETKPPLNVMLPKLNPYLSGIKT